jgi:23S rRNA (cytidine1920-2'-O)/16S rRNA (cytidine1409-2'-O)-methyltransferase
MVQPQIEVGKDRVGKGGVVRDLALRQEAVRSVAASVQATVLGTAPSALEGPSGNRETFLWLAEGAREGAAEALTTW